MRPLWLALLWTACLFASAAGTYIVVAGLRAVGAL